MKLQRLNPGFSATQRSPRFAMQHALGGGESGGILHETIKRLQADNDALRSELATLRLRFEEVERLADMDTLTPLPNRRCFVREVTRVVSQVARYGETAAVMFVDVDGLKGINDRLGHSAGDAALNHVAALLRREVRAGDLVARIGGDEFGLLLSHLDEAAAAAKAAALVTVFEQSPLDLGGMLLTVGLSLGVAMVGPEDSVDALLARADAHMYAAKTAQRSAK